MTGNPNITKSELAVVDDVRKLLLEVLAVPIGALERAVQAAHESTAGQKDDPEEIFEARGVTRQALRMFWHFRCNLEAVMPAAKED